MKMNMHGPLSWLYPLSLLLALTNIHSESAAQALLKNIAPEKLVIGSSPPVEFIPTPSWTYFFSNPKQNRLFRTDGTSKGSQQINSGAFFSGSSNQAEGIYWKGKFIFQGYDPLSGWELRRVHPTLPTSLLVLDLNPKTNGLFFPYSSRPRGFVASNSGVFFHADTLIGDALLRTDGTTKGTVPLHVSKGKLSGLTMLGQRVFFYEEISSAGKAFFGISDGTVAGTRRFAAPKGVGRGRSGRSFAVLGKRVFFVAKTANQGEELWVSDGTATGTRILKDLLPGAQSSRPGQLQVLGKQLFFAASDASAGRELWVSDGTAKGTVLFKDLDPGAQRSGDPKELRAWGRGFVFSAVSAGMGRELWISDGTAKGTKLLADLQKGSGSSDPRAYLPMGKLLFFFASPKPGQLALYRSDGTGAGTQAFFPLGLEPRSFASAQLGRVGNRLLFSNTDPLHGEECWVSDGTLKGTKLLIDIMPNRKIPVGSSPRSFLGFGNRSYFTAKIPGKGERLWVSDGTPKGTQSLPVSPLYGSLYPIGRGLLFVKEGKRGQDLRFFDPVTQGTSLVRSFQEGIWPLTPFGDRLLFIQGDPNRGRRVWVTDGTTQGTKLFAPIPAKAKTTFSDPIPFSRQEKKAILVGPYNSQGSRTIQVWVSDGTKAGTQVLTTFAPTQPIHFISLLASQRVGKDLFFLLRQVEGTQDKVSLWRTDGTPQGTRTLVLFTGMDKKPEMAELGGKLIFTNFESKAGFELWISDGTTQGTKLLADLEPGRMGSNPHSLKRIGKQVLFFAETKALSRVLYRSDGTTQGTKVLKIIKNGKVTGLGYPSSLHRLGSRYLAFAANDGKGGLRFWVSDGSPQGTNPKSSPFRSFNLGGLPFAALSHGNFFFSWNSFDYGEEPWIWFPGATARAYGFGCNPGGTPISLAAEDPVLGKSLRLEGKLDQRFPIGILLFGLAPRIPFALSGGCLLYLDPAKPMLQIPLRSVGKPWLLRLNIPNQAGLLGLVLSSQVLQPFVLHKIGLSNPVELGFGK